MSVTRPFNLSQFISDHRDQLKPPVGNMQVYKDVQDFIVMVVGGPNSRKDFHYNQTEELFYQLEGDITVRIIEDGRIVPVKIQAGDMFLLPARVYHSPQRGPGTVGLVIEKVRDSNEQDSFSWYCEECTHKLYEVFLPVDDIVAQLPPIMNDFFADEAKRTCEKCGAVMLPPEPAK